MSRRKNCEIKIRAKNKEIALVVVGRNLQKIWLGQSAQLRNVWKQVPPLGTSSREMSPSAFSERKNRIGEQM